MDVSGGFKGKNRQRRNTMLTNYHTHCKRCGHAGGDEEEYVVEAINNKFEILGMSDHIPYPDFDYGSRMEFAKKDEYLDTLENLKEKYKKKITLYAGFESEYLPEYDKYYEQLLNDKRCDYLILGPHFYQKSSGTIQYVYDIYDEELYDEYAKNIIEAMKTGYFKFVCHPDLIGVNDFKIGKKHLRAFDTIANAASKYGFTLEYNANGLRRGIAKLSSGSRIAYPRNELWDMIKGTDIKVVVGSDCHSVDALNDEYMAKSLEFIGHGFNHIEEIQM